jgi:hypothetical protein
MDERQFAHALDQAQEHADRWYGPTTHPHYMSPGEQREHAMGDAHLTGDQNLVRDRDFVSSELKEAQHAHLNNDPAGEMRHLGAAIHALEDSYSDAHVWRGNSVYSGDPHAPVQSFNLFDPLGLRPFSPGVGLGTEGTHDPRFDHVPVDANGNPILQNHQAAVSAGAETLATYHRVRDGDPATAGSALERTVGGFFQPAHEGVHVNNSWLDHSWRAEADRRLDIAHTQEQQHHTDNPNDHAAPTPNYIDPQGNAHPANASDAQGHPVYVDSQGNVHSSNQTPEPGDGHSASNTPAGTTDTSGAPVHDGHGATTHASNTTDTSYTPDHVAAHGAADATASSAGDVHTTQPTDGHATQVAADGHAVLASYDAGVDHSGAAHASHSALSGYDAGVDHSGAANASHSALSGYDAGVDHASGVTADHSALSGYDAATDHSSGAGVDHSALASNTATDDHSTGVTAPPDHNVTDPSHDSTGSATGHV